VSLLPGASLTSASGLVLTTSGGDSHTAFGTFNSTDGAWSAAGILSLQGGGGPSLTLTVAKSQGTLDSVAASGSATLRPWRVGDDVISAEFARIDLSSSAGVGAAAGRRCRRSLGCWRICC
jgi:hypothetical protein